MSNGDDASDPGSAVESSWNFFPDLYLMTLTEKEYISKAGSSVGRN